MNKRNYKGENPTHAGGKSMNNTIVVISQKKAFLVMTIMKNLTDESYHVHYSDCNVSSINSFHDDSSIFIFFMEDGTAVDQEVLVYLKDISTEEGKMVILIGSQDEIQTAYKIIPQEQVSSVFLRPFDMHEFIRKIQELTDEKERENRKKCILIVDDDITYLKMVQSWLKDQYRVSIAASGLQAITWLAKNQADLILLDYEMPVTDGPSILEMLKSESDTASIPVFFLTGKRDTESVQKAISMQPDRYLLKTIGKDVLLSELEKFFIAQKTLKK